MAFHPGYYIQEMIEDSGITQEDLWSRDDEYFIVVLEEDGNRYRFRTAFPSNKEYYEHCVRNDGTYLGIWGGNK